MEGGRRQKGGGRVLCNVEVVWGQQERGEALGGGQHAAEPDTFQPVNLHFPRGNLWLCNLGNSVFTAPSTVPRPPQPTSPDHCERGPDLQQRATTSHFH